MEVLDAFDNYLNTEEWERSLKEKDRDGSLHQSSTQSALKFGLNVIPEVYMRTLASLAFTCRVVVIVADSL